IQMQQYRCPEVILGTKWGTSVDCWSVVCGMFTNNGSELIDPTPGPRNSKDDDHITQIIELLKEF
ncbi:uncharacterized protein F5891DRAFT_894659, partial [Suillus fuscotomentosus]